MKLKIISNFRTLIGVISKTFNLVKMDNHAIVPPSSVKNMTILNKDAFVKVTSVPSIIVNLKDFDQTIKKSKKYMLKLRKLSSVLVPKNDTEMRQILLNPEFISSENDVQSIMGINLNEIHGKYSMTEVTINYDNWQAHQILEAVLPDDMSGCSAFTVVGHILQLNLKEHLLPYKNLIAQVYLEKISNISLVVNKNNIIDNSDNTFRTFSMEKLAGETESTITTMKENGCTFNFDFAKVYWNSRLSTEHEKIAKKLKTEDVLFDVMAGVGPFAIPAGKRKCLVYANDLNPASYESLKNNCDLNKVTNYVHCYQMDGKNFIATVLKDKLLEILEDKDFSGSVHITMNLPSIAIDFLPSFIGLYSSNEAPDFHNDENYKNSRLPIMHVYMFSYNETKEYATHLVASKLGYCFRELVFDNEKDLSAEDVNKNIDPIFKKHIIEVVNIRRVAPTKIMFRVSFYIPKDILYSKNDVESQPSKRVKI